MGRVTQHSVLPPRCPGLGSGRSCSGCPSLFQARGLSSFLVGTWLPLGLFVGSGIG